MIKITIMEHSGNGKTTSPGRISVDCSDDIYEIEVGALWGAIKDGGFERKAKGLLEKICAERGLDAGKLLR
jgi:hypothetical protein